jgi:probable rRNA maturation factor
MPPTLLLDLDPRVAWKLPFAAPELREILAAMLTAAGCDGCRLELAVLDDAAMAALQEQSLGRQGPTNILSFPAGDALRDFAAEDAPPSPALGWLALSADTLLRECFLYGQGPEEHAIRLLAHGLAHLTGLDHGPDMDALCARLEEAAAAALRRKAE